MTMNFCAMSDTKQLILPQDTIDLWIVRPGLISNPELLAAYDGLMTPQEREKQQKKRYDEDKHDALVTRALVRTVLSRYADVKPEQWRFVKGDKGKPEIEAPPLPLRFNISHSTAMIVCAVTLDADLGVDVEYIERNNRLQKIAEHKFAPSEYRELLSQPADNFKKRFFDYWTLKEAYIKAVGDGLSIPLDSFYFAVNNDNDIAIDFAPERCDSANLWHHKLLWGSAVHRLAISVKDPKKQRLRTFETIPLHSVQAVRLPLSG